MWQDYHAEPRGSINGQDTDNTYTKHVTILKTLNIENSPTKHIQNNDTNTKQSVLLQGSKASLPRHSYTRFNP